MDIKHICYTGVGARKHPKHSVKQFLKVMKQKNTSCKRWMKKRKCKSCKRSRQISSYIKRQRKKNPNYKMSHKLSKKMNRLMNQCSKCSEKINKEKPCDLQDFIKWSGADVNGNC